VGDAAFAIQLSVLAVKTVLLGLEVLHRI
jgi:hypothetical protein